MKTLNKVAFVKAKANGLNNAQAAIVAGSEAKNPRQVGWQLSNNSEVQIMIDKAIRVLDITVIKALQPIADALGAEKDNGSADYNVRLKASQMAQELLGVKAKHNPPTPPPEPLNIKELNAAMKSGDDVALYKAVFTKSIDRP